MTRKDLLAEVRRRKQRLEGVTGVATLRRLEYACGLREVKERRAFEEEGADDYLAWAKEALGLARTQANAYLAAALVPPELVQGRSFDLDGLALLGRVSDKPEIQRELAAGIERLGRVKVERVWSRLRKRLRGTAEGQDRVLALLCTALADSAAKVLPRDAPKRELRVRGAARVLLGLSARHTAGEELTPGEWQTVTDLLGQLAASSMVRQALGGKVGFPTISENPNDSRKQGMKSSQEKLQDSLPHSHKKSAAPLAQADEDEEEADGDEEGGEGAEGEGEEADGEGEEADGDEGEEGDGDEDAEEDDDVHREYNLGEGLDDDDDEDLDDEDHDAEDVPDYDEPPPLAAEDAAVALAAGLDEAGRGGLSEALAALSSAGYPDKEDYGRRWLRALATARGLTAGSDPALAAWVERATELDARRRFPLAFPALLALDDPGLPYLLWALAGGSNLPPPLHQQARAAAEARPFPPLPAPGDEEGLAYLKAAGDAVVEKYKALGGR